MTFLKKLGSVLAKVLAIAAGIGPLVVPFLGQGKAAQEGATVVNDLTSIGQVVVQAEAMIQAPGSGAQKLAASEPLVAQIIMTSQMVSGHKIANPDLFTQGATKITSGVADILNSLDHNAVQTTGSPMPPPPTTVTVVPAAAPTVKVA